MNRTLVIDVVGLTPSMLGPDAPNLTRLAEEGAHCPLQAVTPAVTTTAQSTMLTGTSPREHGIVGNGWYFRDLAEVLFWRQSNALVQAEPVWDAARRREPGTTCAQMFWWYNMYGSADISATPRPMYPADGRKIPDIYAEPPELREHLTEALGRFPLFDFWGPTAGIASSRWIADATLDVMERSQPSLTLCYLPHLDYNLQRLGPDHPDIAADISAVDAVAGDLIARAEHEGIRVVVVSEYGITPVSRPIHVNRILREHGLLRVREELGRELLDPGASDAFAVADHQIAHVYVSDPEKIDEVARLLAAVEGVEEVLTGEGKRARDLDHPRSGEIVLVSEADAWFTYYHFLDDDRAPDFARTVDIHRKPGYDPVELFVDPALRFPRLTAARKLARKQLGFRYLMDLIPLDAGLVRGSHGRPTDDPAHGPLIMSSEPGLLPEGPLEQAGVKNVILDHLFAGTSTARVPEART